MDAKQKAFGLAGIVKQNAAIVHAISNVFAFPAVFRISTGTATGFFLAIITCKCLILRVEVSGKLLVSLIC